MIILVLGLILFIGAHMLPAFVDLRAKLKAQLGASGYQIAFSLLSLVGLVLIVWGYGLAREDPVVLWTPPTFLSHLAALLMIPVFPLLVAAYWKPGRIKGTLKHPMLVAVKLWALAHLLANGMLADLLLFGGLLAYAVFDRISVKKRERAGLLAPAATGPASNDLVPVVAGLAVYILFVLWLHEALIGIRPLPIGTPLP